MINIFLQDYYARLREWHELKENLKTANIKTICTEVDSFWQKVPLQTYYLHPADVFEWPTPWVLINDNNYCLYARALGMIYTLMFLGIKDIALVEAKDDNNNELVLVLVDNAKYILNYWPETVLNNQLQDFTVTKKINITPLSNKLG